MAAIIENLTLKIHSLKFEVFFQYQKNSNNHFFLLVLIDYSPKYVSRIVTLPGGGLPVFHSLKSKMAAIELGAKFVHFLEVSSNKFFYIDANAV